MMCTDPHAGMIVGPRILIVEDDPDQATLITTILRDRFAGSRFVHAACCDDASRMAAEDLDIALVDLNLPDGSGIDVVRRLLAKCADLPIILVTGERFGQPAADAIRAGASDYLVKHGDYLRVLPIVVQKTLTLSKMKSDNARLQRELLDRNEELESLNRQLKDMAAHDALTGLYNRRHFNEVFHQLFAESDRYGTDLTCMMIDLDGFKSVNDRMGHQVGDRLLVLAADALRSALRASDVAARYGGDEFVLLLPRTAPMDARHLAKRIRSLFRDTVRRRDPDAAQVTLSIGVASREHNQPPTFDALLRLADDALYQAKAAGKDRIMVVHPIAVEA